MRNYEKNMVKLLAAILMMGALITPVAAQQQSSPNAGDKVKNRAPVINSLTASITTVTIPCPGWREPNKPCGPDGGTYLVSITTDANDPDGDKLSYKYFVAGGRIIGEGAQVDWDYTGAFPGLYPIRVTVKDNKGGIKSKSVIVHVAPCPNCVPPCPTIAVTGPSDLEEGQPAVFNVNVTGGDPDVKLTYNWSVSSGKIIKGQGTRAVEVDTAGIAEQDLKASVKLGELAPECQAEAASTTHVKKKPEEPK